MTKRVSLRMSAATRFLAICASLALFASCETLAGGHSSAASLAVSARSCVQAPDPFYVTDDAALQVTRYNAIDVERICGRVVEEGQAQVEQFVNALYFRGRANRLIAEYYPEVELRLPEPRATPTQYLERAGADLSRALALRPEFHLARLERVNVYREQARASHSSTQSREALDEIETLLRIVPRPGDPVHAAAHFFRSAIFIDLLPADGTGIMASMTLESARQSAHDDTLPALTWDSTLRDLANFTDSQHEGTSERPEHPYRQQALDWLAQYANELGCNLVPCGPSEIPEAWSGAALSRESVQRSIEYFSLAQSAVDAVTNSRYVHPRFVETYVHLGRARTYMAGLLGPNGTVHFGCVAGVGNAAMLEQARTDLQTALARDDSNVEVNRALACVALALNDPGAASAYAEAASSPSAASFLMLARVQAAQRNWNAAVESYRSAAAVADVARSLIYLELARAQLHSPPQQAILESAFHAAASPQMTDARDSLTAAISADSTNRVAQLELGKLHFYLEDYYEAESRLSDFDVGHQATGVGDRATRAEALLYLSRIRSRPPLADAADAIRNADDAFALNGAWQYREQACLARLVFGRVAFSQAGPRAICAPGDDAPPGHGSLLEGMYHLRRAATMRRDDREREWEDAFRAFTQGINELSAIAVDTETRVLRAKLQYGLGTAQYCIGFAELGNQAIQAIEVGYQSDAREYFARHGIATCPPRR